ncbi:hypothetical protein [Pyxidicoccus xibeiensis]|uniref:hypothetical protein n=1 Tax=Pyxidicoccus xibeiensis TaxID=2906759 RepID=UPI0020A6ED4D|nr:hypothetical protein [Pyxidicoccus xibeiensis]MCP3140263.1 hypothetical protein [Pyxidicoccus xibeiensis]
MEIETSSAVAPTLDLSLEQVHKRIMKLVEQGHRNAYQIGRLYNYVVDSELAQKGGFKNAQDFFRQSVKGLGQSVLTRNGAVARAFSETVALKYGISNLYTLMTYAKLAGLTLEPSDPGATAVAVPQQDGTLLNKSFADCSVEELQGAVNHRRTPPVPLPEKDAARVQHYRDNLQRHFTDKLGIRVDARSHMGELLITLRDIPEKEMRRLAAALVDEPVQHEEEVQAPVSSNSPAPSPMAPTPEAARAEAPSAPATPVARTAANDTPAFASAPPMEPVRDAAHNDTPTAPPGLSAVPMGAGPGPSAGTPAQGGPRNKAPGLSGFLRRMTGG